MKTNIFVPILGILFFFGKSSFGQDNRNYKQQFNRIDSDEQICSNVGTDLALNRNYKQGSLLISEKDFNAFKSNACLKEFECENNCCWKDQVTSNYKHHPDFANSKLDEDCNM